jgi:hypothetical protein
MGCFEKAWAFFKRALCCGRARIEAEDDDDLRSGGEDEC